LRCVFMVTLSTESKSKDIKMVKSFFGDNCAAYGPIFSARCETN